MTGRTTAINREAFVSTALEFLGDGEALRRMSPAAAEHIRANFTFDRQLQETLALYHRLAALPSEAHRP